MSTTPDIPRRPFFNPLIPICLPALPSLGSPVTPSELRVRLAPAEAERASLRAISTLSSRPIRIPRTPPVRCNGFATNCREQRSCAAWLRRPLPTTQPLIQPQQGCLHHSFKMLSIIPLQRRSHSIRSPILACSREVFRCRSFPTLVTLELCLWRVPWRDRPTRHRTFERLS